jgi:hypothetical protein
MAILTLNISTIDTTPLRAMEMVVTPMAIGTMAETRETTPMVTRMEEMITTMESMETITEAMEITMEAVVTKMEAMDIKMEVMDNTVSTRVLRRICRISPSTSARRHDILLISAQRRNLMKLPSLIHSRRDM